MLSSKAKARCDSGSVTQYNTLRVLYNTITTGKALTLKPEFTEKTESDSESCQ